MGRGSIHLSPGEREAVGRAVARVFFWLGRELGWPWWGSLLAWFGVAGAGFGVYLGWDKITDWLRR